MLQRSRTFGEELRRRRIEAGLTIVELAARVHYSKGQLSKVETGSKRPSPQLARLCDAALGADGALEALLPERSPRGGARPEGVHAGPGDAPLDRRRLLGVGAASVLALGAAAPVPGRTDDGGTTLLDVSRALFGHYRRLGQSVPPAALLPALEEQIRLLQHLAGGTGRRTAQGLVALSARYAEFAGWMAQEAGDERGALRWTDQAVELAAASGDRHLASYALVRRGLITYYRGEASETVAFAEGARSGALPPRIRGLAAQRRAQGHALAGAYDPCMRALDEARELLARAAAEEDGAPLLGTTHVPDPAAMTAGWCLLDLGRPAEAAEVLDRECRRLPAEALRTQARYGVRRALAHALAGNPEEACDVADRLLTTTDLVGSATIAVDLRRLGRTLSRYAHRPAYRAVAPRLTGALAAAGTPYAG
ncbi:helix-turn-helix domain-containing protein [Streptomyces coeruleoprunus]|uniref:Helix-turn-helix domain-containing protein n=1 Tax=Streptomyces coeruleoprunus TaxID=285563 RepID=A0ABV9XDC9_9ACTN